MKDYRNQLDDDDLEELTSLRKSILCKDAENGLILRPQIQANNLPDFVYAMSEVGLINNCKKEKNWGLRRIAKCFRYFSQRIAQDMSQSDESVQALLEIKRKISKAILVKIEVSSHAEAYTLFESLNNRGTPLTAIDLMKNLILARAEKAGLACDECFSNWQTLLDFLTDDYGTQERFFRQYYNAFKNKLNMPFRGGDQKKNDPLGYIATRSNLLSICEQLISRDLSFFIEDTLCCGKIYAQFILSTDDKTAYTDALRELSRIQGAPSYLLLMYLFHEQESLALTQKELQDTVKLLTRFFVRRNITDYPNTRDLTRLFMAIIDDIEDNGISGQEMYTYIRQKLVERSASDELFMEKLSGDIYEDNVQAARFVLCAIAQKSMTTETWTDLWEQSVSGDGKKVYQWTIEHIFPEGDNIPVCWVDMIADGDKAKAEEYLSKYVHKLGNLTITRYNSNLGNMAFDKKRDRMKDGVFVGYRNGLALNSDIAKKEKWTTVDICNRTEKLANIALEMNRL